MFGENAFEQKMKKTELKFNPGLAPIDLRTTGLRLLDENGKSNMNFVTHQTIIRSCYKPGEMSNARRERSKAFRVGHEVLRRKRDKG